MPLKFLVGWDDKDNVNLTLGNVWLGVGKDAADPIKDSIIMKSLSWLWINMR